jgi:hypothetical protein
MTGLFALSVSRTRNRNLKGRCGMSIISVDRWIVTHRRFVPTCG